MVTNLTMGQVSSWRLKRQHLTRKARKGDLQKVAADVCGVQAQVLSAAELALRARIDGLRQEDVRQALWESHTLFKTWSMRGTLHLLAAPDLQLYACGLRSKLVESKLWLGDDLGVGAKEVDEITDQIGRILKKRQLTREELAREVERKLSLREELGGHLRSSWGVLLKPAAYEGSLVFGESIGPRATFVNPERWVDGRRRQNSSEALSELFTRFVRAYGPASIRDFGHWWGGLRDEDRAVLESSIEDLEEVSFGGLRGYMTRQDAKDAKRMGPPRGVHLLPSWDGYVMFYNPRDAFVPRAHKHKLFGQTAGWNYPAVIVDGTVAGIWSIKRGGHGIAIDIEAFRPINPVTMNGIKAEARDIGRFLDSPVEVRSVRR